MRVLALLLAALVALAGCVAPAADLDPASIADADVAAAWDRVAALVADLPCEAQVSAAETSENLLPLAVLRAENGGRANLDAWGDLLVAGHGEGLDVISVHDPMAPRFVATFLHEDGFGDAKFVGDGKYVAAAHGRSIEIVDVSAATMAPAGADVDPDALVSVGLWEYPAPPPGHLFTNMHMLEAHTIGEDDYVFVAPNDDTGVWWFKVDVVDGVASFETMAPIGAPLAGGPLGPHDMSVIHDEILDKPILYIANGFEGWQAWDISDPASPKRLLVLPNLGPGQGYTHTVAAGKVGDRRIVATIAEVGVNTLRIFDVTDFARPILLAEWWADKARPHLPQHDINIVAGYLTMGHYTKGAYVFDLNKLGSTPLVGSVTLSPVAHFVPTNPMEPGTLGFANVFDVVTVNGVLYVSDFTDAENAVTPVAFGCLAAGDVALDAA